MGSQKPLSYSTPNMRRSNRNQKEAAKLAAQGYSVHTSVNYPNNAFYAIENGAEHLAHEEEVVKILAENGISTKLYKEGTIVVRGNQMPSFDGEGHGLTFEIRQTKEDSSISLAHKVAEAISHSRKESKTTNYIIQADAAISYTKNSLVRESTVLDGIEAHSKRSPSNQGAPRFMLQIDGINRKVYVYKINGGR